MASIRQLKDKVKTFMDFQKVVNIQKIVVMKEIAERKKIIEGIKFRNQLFNNYIIDIQKKYHAYDPALFSTKAGRVPIKRNMHFIMGNPKTDKISEYSYKLITEFAKKNNKKNDMYVTIGKDISDYVRRAGFNIISEFDDNAINSNKTFSRIAYQITRGFRDLSFIKSSFIYLNISERKVVQEYIFPLSKEKVMLTDTQLELVKYATPILDAVKFSNVNWYRDVDFVASNLLVLALQMKIHKIMIEYRLSMKLRQLQSLDDKERNIKDEIEVIKLQMQRVRKESVTNELLTNAAAFSAIGGGDDDDASSVEDEIIRKREEEDEYQGGAN